MRFKQMNPQPLRKKYGLYSPTSLTNAFKAAKDKGMSVKGAARQYSVPVTTLRDRILGKIDPETVTTGRVPIFNQLEESQLVNHLKVMASYGYGYSRQETVDLASDYAHQLNKFNRGRYLSFKWFRGFVKRWPDLRLIKPRSLEESRAKSTSLPKVNHYFEGLEKILNKYELMDKPYLIYNIDEKGVSANHTPPHVVSGTDYHPQAVTRGKSNTITVLGSGNASGMNIPPFFVFPGVRMMPDLLSGATPGADGTVTETGWSNSDVFRIYLENHFLKYVPVKDDQKVLVLLDGHKSHASVGLVDWAKSKNIILFILPAHTSHVLQPLDVGCFGPFTKMYNAACHKFTRESHGTITRYNVCELVCKIYNKALSADNLQSSFKKTGIFPFNKDVMQPAIFEPAKVFVSELKNKTGDSSKSRQEVDEHESMENNEPEASTSNRHEKDSDRELGEQTGHGECANSFFQRREETLCKVKSEGAKKERNTMSKIISGCAITEDGVLEKMKLHEEKQNKKCKSKGTSSKKGGKKVQKKIVRQKKTIKENYNDDSQSLSDDSDIEDGELCCVCKRFSPKELRNSVSLVITKWAQCDAMVNGNPCNHWTHLIYCSTIRVVRRNDKFYCPCHSQSPSNVQ